MGLVVGSSGRHHHKRMAEDRPADEPKYAGREASCI
jgi:hypothetical protein